MTQRCSVSSAPNAIPKSASNVHGEMLNIQMATAILIQKNAQDGPKPIVSCAQIAKGG